MTRRQAIAISTGLLAAAAPGCRPAQDKAAAKRLHLALLVLTMNDTLRERLKNEDHPDQLPDGHILKRVFTQWPELYQKVRGNIKGASGLDSAAVAFREVFRETSKGLPVRGAAATDPYPVPEICPCSDAPSDACDAVGRLLG